MSNKVISWTPSATHMNLVPFRLVKTGFMQQETHSTRPTSSRQRLSLHLEM